MDDEQVTSAVGAWFEVTKRIDQSPFYLDLQLEPSADTELISILIEAAASDTDDWSAS